MNTFNNVTNFIFLKLKQKQHGTENFEKFTPKISKDAGDVCLLCMQD